MGNETEKVFQLDDLTLTADQHRAVVHDDGALIVLAGPGTGKTRVITARVAHMIGERGIEPEQIVAVTFTNKAAGELGDRLGEFVGPTKAARVVASTFHSLGLGIVRRFGDVIGVKSDPILIDSSQRRQLIREIIREGGLYKRELGAGIDSAVELATKNMDALRYQGMDSVAAVDWLNGQRGAIDEVDWQEPNDRAARIAQLDRFGQAIEGYGRFESRCLDRGWMVFDDLILLPSRLMRDHPDIAAILRHDHKHVVVDEFQDVNAAQIEMIRQLCPPETNPDLCVVGDDDQSIYGFRGADEHAFAHFDRIWNSPTKITLSTNFRSTSEIVEASNAVIEGAALRFDDSKKGESHIGQVDGSRVELVRLEDDKQSGEVISAMLLKMASDAQEAGDDFSFGSCAVIARTKNELEGIARVLMLKDIPIEMRDHISPMDDEGVQDVLAWCRLLVDPTSSMDIKRILVRGPYHCDAIKLGGCIASWRVARSRFDEGDEEASDPGMLLDWIVEHGDEQIAKRGRLMGKLAEELSAIGSESSAAWTLMEIIKRTGVVHRELADGRSRASRVASLVALVRFAKTRADRFDEPGDIEAMLRYWEDLDPGERSLGELPEDRVVSQNQMMDDGQGDLGAVSMLTAHASKGLEFDTVFVPRVSGPHGYPKSGQSDSGDIPDGLVDLGDDFRDEKSRKFDEERRVFYVALTRAHRRAVLLAKVPKKPSSVNFVYELRSALGEELVELDASDVLDPSQAGDAVSRLGVEFSAVRRMRDVIEQAKRDVRRDAAIALDAMELGELSGEELGVSLGQVAQRAAVVRAVLESGEVPLWANGSQVESFGAGLVDAIGEARAGVGGSDDELLHPGLKGPLRLSFTQISSYLHCPRCYLVERVLDLPSEEGAPAVVGKAVHQALEAFYQRWRVADAEGQDTPGFELLDELAKRYFFELWPRDAEVESDKLEQMQAMIRSYWEQMHRDDVHIEELEKKMVLPYEYDGVVHTIHAVLDRVDATESGGRRVIDYKTGYPRKELAEPKKDDLQLGIYAMALEEAFGDPGPGSMCEYWLLQDGTKGTIGMDGLDMKKIRKKIDKAIAGMLGGDWEQGSRCRNGSWASACEILDDLSAQEIAKLK